MMNFACKNFRIEEVVRCSLNLTRSEYSIVDFLLKNSDERFTTARLAEEHGLDLSTVQRSVKKLYSQELIRRSQKNLERGGYIFVYRIKNKKELKEKISGIIHSWVGAFDKEIRKW